MAQAILASRRGCWRPKYLYASDDGRQLQINFYPSTLEARVADEFPDDAVTALSDTSQVASYSYGRRFRYNAELGVDGSIARPAGWDGWLLEVDGQPFQSVEEFMAMVDQIVITPMD